MYRHLRERSVESGYMLRNFSELKSGGTNPMLSPRPEKWGGGRVPPPRPPPIDARGYSTDNITRNSKVIGNNRVTVGASTQFKNLPT